MKHAFFIPGTPIGKPRQTRRDRWMVRDVVASYRAWCDLARSCAAKGSSKLPSSCPQIVDWVAMFEVPRTRRGELKNLGVLHQRKPDRDNIDKALLDAILERDEGVAGGLTMKLWCVSRPGLAVVLWYDEIPHLEERRQALISAGAVQLPDGWPDTSLDSGPRLQRRRV